MDFFNPRKESKTHRGQKLHQKITVNLIIAKKQTANDRLTTCNHFLTKRTLQQHAAFPPPDSRSVLDVFKKILKNTFCVAQTLPVTILQGHLT